MIRLLHWLVATEDRQLVGVLAMAFIVTVLVRNRYTVRVGWKSGSFELKPLDKVPPIATDKMTRPQITSGP